MAGALNFPNLLQVPRPLGPPAIGAGSAKPGATIGCGQGAWKGDIVPASLYRAPTGYAYEWSRNGFRVPGATSASITAADVGMYRCSVIASNPAGSALQASAAVAVFKVGRPKLNKRKGTAKLPVVLPAGGKLTVGGRGVRRLTRVVAGSERLKLTVRSRGRPLRKLRKRGKARVALVLSFAPADGASAGQRRPIVLRKK
jgi:hypothetical protein